MPRRVKIAIVLFPMIAAGLFCAVDAGAQPVDTDPVPQVLLRGLPHAELTRLSDEQIARYLAKG